MIPRIHAAAGVIAFLCILTFWCSTVASELFGNPESSTAVKHAVLWGMWVLVPAMAAPSGTGFKLLGSRADVLALAKKRRMMVIAPTACLFSCPARSTSPAWPPRGSSPPPATPSRRLNWWPAWSA